LVIENRPLVFKNPYGANHVLPGNKTLIVYPIKGYAQVKGKVRPWRTPSRDFLRAGDRVHTVFVVSIKHEVCYEFLKVPKVQLKVPKVVDCLRQAVFL
jgi:hypothetical protein